MPPGTGGTPTVTIPGFSGETIALSGQVLTVTAPGGTAVPAGYTVTIQVGGLTNTSVAGSYTTQIVTTGSPTSGAPVIPLDSVSTGPIAFA